MRLRYFDKTPIGMLITRTVSDLETIADIFSEGLISIIGDMLLVLAIIIWHDGDQDWKLALITMIPMPFLLLSTYIFKEAIKSSFPGCAHARSTAQYLSGRTYLGHQHYPVFQSRRSGNAQVYGGE
jgi:ABC-type multidrug transport system fused ATPase/permease subunit